MLPTTVVGPSPDWVKVTVPSTPAVPVRTQMAFFSSATTERTAERPAETRVDARGARATLENGIGGGADESVGRGAGSVCLSIDPRGNREPRVASPACRPHRPSKRRDARESDHRAAFGADRFRANVDVDRLARSVGAIASLTDPERRVSG